MTTQLPWRCVECRYREYRRRVGEGKYLFLDIWVTHYYNHMSIACFAYFIFFGYYFVFCAFHASLSASTVYYLRKERNKKIWKSRNNERIFFLEHLDRNDSENALKAGQLTQFYILFLFRSFFSTFLFLMNLQKRIWWYSKGRQRRKKNNNEYMLVEKRMWRGIVYWQGEYWRQTASSLTSLSFFVKMSAKSEGERKRKFSLLLSSIVHRFLRTYSDYYQM